MHSTLIGFVRVVKNLRVYGFTGAFFSNSEDGCAGFHDASSKPKTSEVFDDMLVRYLIFWISLKSIG